jgi:hypothetical protein
VTTKCVCQFGLGLAIVACMAGCSDETAANLPAQDADTRKDAAPGPDAITDGQPSDPRLPGEPLADQAVGPVADGGLDATGDQEGGGALDGEGAEAGGLDGFGPLLDLSPAQADAPLSDVSADLAQGDAPSDSRRAPEVRLDGAPMCTEGSTESCASPGNPLIGACRAGTRTCSGGAWGPCSEVLPAASEACNGIDDDCDGMIDEGCAAGCIVVCGNCTSSADGGAVADGSVDRPFATIEAAMAAAGPIDGGTRRRICLVGGSTCRESTLYQTSGPFKMTDGLIIQGAYAITENGLEYCPGANVRPRTALAFASSEGVVFDETIATGAELSSVAIELNPSASDAETVTAIAIKGAKNVTLSRVFVIAGFAATNTRGVAITSGGQATIAGSSISTGQGRASAVGLHVTSGTANLRNNCDRVIEGRCASYCSDGGSMLGFLGHRAASAADAPAESSVVWVAGGTASLVGNMICGGSTNIAEGQPVASLAALRCEGAGCTTVSGNVIAGGNDREVLAVALVGADPLLDSNLIESGCGELTAAATGVRLENSAARLQNNLILGGQCPGAGSPLFRGLHIVSSGTGHSPDVHSNDIEPLGISGDCQSMGVLVEPAPGADSATAGVLRNNIISAGVCNVRFAITEAAGATLQSLRNNDLYGPTGEPPATSLVLYHHGNTDASTAAEVNAIALASGNISADPGYASYPRELHLTEQSPCIDQGTGDGAPATDADGNVRPAGGGPDIGAYEFTN